MYFLTSDCYDDDEQVGGSYADAGGVGEGGESGEAANGGVFGTY